MDTLESGVVASGHDFVQTGVEFFHPAPFRGGGELGVRIRFPAYSAHFVQGADKMRISTRAPLCGGWSSR